MSPFINSVRGTFNTGRFGGGASWPRTTAAASSATWTSPGTYSWTAPAGVWRVSAVCIGAGGGGGYQWSSGGGGGGGLAWANNIMVTPGVTYTVVVGNYGPRIANAYNEGAQGGDSYFINTNTIVGNGGGNGGTFTGYGGENNGVNNRVSGPYALSGRATGGGYYVNKTKLCDEVTGKNNPITGGIASYYGGGAGGWGAQDGSWTTGGAGAGGYTGRGGQYGQSEGTRQGSGGAGTFGGYYSSTYGVSAGGGTDFNGEGTSATQRYTPWTGYYSNGHSWGGPYGVGGGQGGSGASYGDTGENPFQSTPWPNGQNNIYGSNYGGGGGGSGTSSGGGRGGSGGVRLIWGPSGRSAQTSGG